MDMAAKYADSYGAILSSKSAESEATLAAKRGVLVAEISSFARSSAALLLFVNTQSPHSLLHIGLFSGVTRSAPRAVEGAF